MDIDPNKLDPFLKAYIIAALWSSNDESREDGGDPLDDNYSMDDLAPETLATMAADCAVFKYKYKSLWADAESPNGEYSIDERAGHDYWLTRNGHGAGFWDRPEIYGEKNANSLTEACQYQECNLYVGDDGQIYIM